MAEFINIIGRVIWGIIFATNIFCIIQGFLRDKDDFAPHAIGTGIILYVNGIIQTVLYVAGL